MTRATDLEREGQPDQAIPLIESAVGVFQTQIGLAGANDMKPLLQMYLQMYTDKLDKLRNPEAQLEDDFEVIN